MCNENPSRKELGESDDSVKDDSLCEGCAKADHKYSVMKYLAPLNVANTLIFYELFVGIGASPLIFFTSEISTLWPVPLMFLLTILSFVSLWNSVRDCEEREDGNLDYTPLIGWV